MSKPKRKTTYEDDQYAKALGRMVTAMGNRASTNPEALLYMINLAEHTRREIDRAGCALLDSGEWSAAQVAAVFADTAPSGTESEDEMLLRMMMARPMSRQNVRQRWGKDAAIRKGLRVKFADIINLARERAARRPQPAEVQERRAVGE